MAEAPPPPVLRVSAGNELSRIEPQSWTGSTSYALDLVYDPLSDHASIHMVSDRRVVLRRNPASPHDVSTLCAGVYYPGIVDRATSDRDCSLVFESVETRDALVADDVILVEVGPFRVDRVLAREGRLLSTDGDAGPVGAIELVSNGGTAIDRIHILSMPIREEWRRLFAGQIDVIPSTPILYRSRFTGMQSVRTIELPSSGHVSLFFNTRRAPWSSRALRRHVATIIDREAVAALACGEPGCVAGDWEPAAPLTEDVELPARLSILVLASHTPALIAARTISYQLRKHHELGEDDTAAEGVEPKEVKIDIEVLPLEAMLQRAVDGDFDLQIAPLGFLSPAKAENNLFILTLYTAYTHAELAGALRAGDAATATQILAEDVPVLPLYENRQFAAVDTRFCGGAPSDQLSWLWLVDLYPCEQGAPR